MQKSRVWMLFVALAGLAWGVYIPSIAEGGKQLSSPFTAFLCVGVAYFVLAVLAPIIMLSVHHRRPAWNGRGVAFSTLAGVAGAVGALCVVFATITFRGPKLYVAPVIFAVAPVLNTLVSLFWHPDEGPLTFGPPREKPHWSLYLGVVLAGLGAGSVLYAQALAETHGKATPVSDWTFVIFVVLAGLSWGVYVPLIAQGGKELKSSYASFLCVGAAYFAIAIVLPLAMLWYQSTQPAHPRPAFLPPINYPVGATLATLSGAAGAIGALCVIFATFEFKGPRMYVAPVIFAMAPVVNTIVSLFWQPSAGKGPLYFALPQETPHWLLYVGIVAAGLGAGMVLFAKELGEAKHAAHARQQAPAAAPQPIPATEAIKP